MPALIVAAHPDDETLGCGGTIARWTGAGEEVTWLVLGEGSTSRLAPGETDAAGLDQHRRDCRAAADLLGVGEVVHAALPDNRFDSVDLLDIVRVVEQVIDRLRPTVVLTHHAGDLNIDHRMTHQAVLVATRPVPGSTVRTVAAFEVPSSTEWGFSEPSAFVPNVFVDITDTIEMKVEALGHYRSELRDPPHPRSVANVRALATTRGAAAGCAAAEAFQLVRALR